MKLTASMPAVNTTAAKAVEAVRLPEALESYIQGLTEFVFEMANADRWISGAVMVIESEESYRWLTAKESVVDITGCRAGSLTKPASDTLALGGTYDHRYGAGEGMRMTNRYVTHLFFGATKDVPEAIRGYVGYYKRAGGPLDAGFVTVFYLHSGVSTAPTFCLKEKADRTWWLLPSNDKVRT